MKDQKESNPAAATSGGMIAEFKIHDMVMRINYSREHFSKLPAGSIVGVCAKPDKPIVQFGISYPFFVFAARVTSDFGLEQLGEGCPCVDEAQMKRAMDSIQAKSQKVPHVGLVSWPGHFTIATIKNVDCFWEELVLFKFHVPKIVDGQSCGFALRFFRHTLGKDKVLISEELLPTTDFEVAQKMLLKKQEEYKTKHIAEKNAATISQPQPDLSLTPIQLKVLSKAYPETVSFLANPNIKNAEAAFAAYQRESFALTGHFEGTLNKTEFEKIAKAMKNASRRKNPAVDAVEFQLVAGWRLHGYDQMTPKQRFDALKKLGLKPASSEAVRKICERLKLPSVRKRGAPQKSPPTK